MASRKPEHLTLEHPALEHLAATPDVFHALLGGVSQEQVYWKPTPDRFSMAELFEHLSHVEAHYYRSAIDRILAGGDGEIEPYDQNAWHAAGAYSNRDAEESLAHWEDQREANVDFLRGLEPGVLTRSGRHPVLGEVTFANLLNEWALHDLGHIRQLAELVRAQMYYPGMGPFQAQYVVRP
jgi:DinB superfamily